MGDKFEKFWMSPYIIGQFVIRSVSEGTIQQVLLNLSIRLKFSSYF